MGKLNGPSGFLAFGLCTWIEKFMKIDEGKCLAVLVR